jgi:hypothetical protein
MLRIDALLAAANSGRRAPGVEGFEDVFHVFQTALVMNSVSPRMPRICLRFAATAGAF